MLECIIFTKSAYKKNRNKKIILHGLPFVHVNNFNSTLFLLSMGFLKIYMQNFNNVRLPYRSFLFNNNTYYYKR